MIQRNTSGALHSMHDLDIDSVRGRGLRILLSPIRTYNSDKYMDFRQFSVHCHIQKFENIPLTFIFDRALHPGAVP